MHIPDGFLSIKVWAAMWLATAVFLCYALKKVKGGLGDKQVPMMGVLAAFIFAAQMLNIPVAGGTSGHLLGGVLAASLLGPWTASVVMASVFFVQGIFFQDGGLTALGANIFNMGLIGTILGYWVYSAVGKLFGGDFGRYAGLAVAGWLAIMLAAGATAVDIAASGKIPVGVVLPAMLAVHAVIGIIEAVGTVAVVAYIKKARPDLLELKKI